MRLLKEFLEQSELLHQLEGGGMNRIAAKIAIEIRMLFQDGHLHTSARQKKPEHHARRSAPRHHATCPKRFCVTHSEPITWRVTRGKYLFPLSNGDHECRDFSRGNRWLRQLTRLRDQPGDEEQNARQQQRNSAPPFGEKARGGRGRECHLAVVLHDGDDVVVEMSHVPSALRFDVHLHRLAVTKAFHLPFSGHKRRALVIRAPKRILKRKR